MSVRGTSSLQHQPTAGRKQLIAVPTDPAKLFVGPQSQRLVPLISDDMSDTEHLSAGLAVMKPLKVAKPHIHEHTESVIYFTEGWFATLVGPELTPIFHGPGDIMYVPEGVIHVGINLSADHQAVVLEVRAEPHFNDDVVVLEEYVERVNAIAKDLQAQFAKGTLPLPKDWQQRGFGPFAYTDHDSTG